jgi:hypothetical protein
LKDPQSGFVDNRFIAPLESFHQYQCKRFYQKPERNDCAAPPPLRALSEHKPCTRMAHAKAERYVMPRRLWRQTRSHTLILMK